MSEPYREQKISLLCASCHEPAACVCPGCGRPFCADHAPPRFRGCAECEAAYETSQVKWAPGGWPGFLIILAGTALSTTIGSIAFCRSYDVRDTTAMWILSWLAAALVPIIASIIAAIMVPRRVFFRARRRQLAEPEGPPHGT